MSLPIKDNGIRIASPKRPLGRRMAALRSSGQRYAALIRPLAARTMALFMSLAAALTVLAGCGQAAPEAVPELIEPVGVTVDTAVVRRDTFYTLEARDGFVQPKITEIRSPGSGVIREEGFYPGAWVEAGDLLFSLDRSRQEAEVAALREELAALREQHSLSSELEATHLALLEARLQKLMTEAGVAAPQDAAAAGATGADGAAAPITAADPTQQAAIAALQAEMEEYALTARQASQARELEIRTLSSRISAQTVSEAETEVTAPVSGHVSYDSTRVGQGMSIRQDQILAGIADPKVLTVRVEGYITDERLRNAEYYAHIVSRDVEIALIPQEPTDVAAAMAAGETVYTDFEIKADASVMQEIHPGDSAALIIRTGETPDCLMIPDGAVYGTGLDRYCYVRTPEGVRERRSIRIGDSNGVDTEVLDGLEEGEVVYVRE